MSDGLLFPTQGSPLGPHRHSGKAYINSEDWAAEDDGGVVEAAAALRGRGLQLGGVDADALLQAHPGLARTTGTMLRTSPGGIPCIQRAAI